MPPITLLSQSYTFDPRPAYPLLITLNRYYLPSPPPPAHAHLASTSPSARTLILAHGTGFHKEQWEPALKHLFERLAERKDEGIEVREAWIIDAPNHGDAAVLNEKTLRWGYTDIFPWEDYGRALHAVLSNSGTGVDVDFSKRTLVGIGHSMGAVGLILSTTYSPQIPYTTLLLAEPMILPPPVGLPNENATSNMLQRGAEKRRDRWGSKKEALETFRTRGAWKAWDMDVLELFVEHGLRDLPTLDYPDEKSGVTLKCSKFQEAATYRDSIGRIHAYRLLPSLTRKLPVHVVYGAIDDYVSRDFKDQVIAHAESGGAKLASLVRVEGSGHLIVQTQPRGLAEALCAAIVHPVSLAAAAVQSGGGESRTVVARL